MKLLNMPKVKWARTVAKMNADQMMRLSDEAARLSTEAARVSAYISRRLSGGKHDDAVKAQNRVARGVRQALGYTYKDDAISF